MYHRIVIKSYNRIFGSDQKKKILSEAKIFFIVFIYPSTLVVIKLKSFCLFSCYVIVIQSTLPKSNSQSNNRQSQRSFQVLFSLFSLFFTPHK